MRKNRSKNKMNTAKLGVMFIVAAMALAGVGAGYSAWFDTITIEGTVNTGNVDIVIKYLSGTEVWKDLDTDECVVIYYIWDTAGNVVLQVDEYGDYVMPPTDGLLVAYAYAEKVDDDKVTFTYNNLFPSIDFIADVALHYDGTIPVKVNEITWEVTSGNDWIEPLIASGDIMGIAREVIPEYPYVRNDVIVEEGYQLHQCEWVGIALCIHLPQQDDLMGRSGSATCTFEVVQWNEYPYDGGECGDEPCDLSKTYTYDADFDEGILTNVNHDPNHDQLQLNEQLTTLLPLIWVPNNDGTVSKVNTDTGDELGRYHVAPFNGDPSRTTVDLFGNCWVGNRDAGTVVKIGLVETGTYIDRNGNGVCDTSQDLNSDGDITGAEILPWPTDECVLYEVLLRPGFEGTFVPGTIPLASYDTGHWSTSPRGLAIDANNNLWAGTWLTDRYFYIDGATGAILQNVDVSSQGLHAYGAVVDGNGILWSSSLGGNSVLRLDPNPPYSHAVPDLSKVDFGRIIYGLGLDYLDHLFVAGWTSSKLGRININTAGIDWDKTGPYEGRGVAVTGVDNNVWVASTEYDEVYRYDNDGVLITTIAVGDGPTGVAVDSNGKVWVCNLYDDTIQRINPATNLVELTKPLLGTGGHYSYSDMTGVISQTVTTQTGTWEVEYNAGVPAIFDMITWTEFVPAGTSITVEIASSIDGITWSGWETVTNGGAVSVPNGQYLKVKVTFQITSGDVSPILYDLTIHASCVV